MDYLLWIGQSSTGTPTKVDYNALYSDAGSAGYGASHGAGKEGKGDSAKQLQALQKSLDESYAAIIAQERELLAELIGFLTSDKMRAKGVRIVGTESADPTVRAPTVSFILADAQGRASDPRAVALQKILIGQVGDKIGFQQGHMYAYALLVPPPAAIAEEEGVVRVSFVHYNTLDEVREVCRAIEAGIDAL